MSDITKDPLRFDVAEQTLEEAIAKELDKAAEQTTDLRHGALLAVAARELRNLDSICRRNWDRLALYQRLIQKRDERLRAMRSILEKLANVCTNVSALPTDGLADHDWTEFEDAMQTAEKYLEGDRE